MRKIDAVRIGAVLASITLAVLLITGDIDSDVAWTIAGLAVLSGLAALVSEKGWERFIARISKASVGPVSLELVTDVRVAAGETASKDDEEGSDSRPPKTREPDLTAVRLRLEWKLAFVAKHLLDPDCCDPEYLNVGSLFYDKYLTEVQARTAVAILTTRDLEVTALGIEGAKQFVNDASVFVDGVRATVFWNWVKKVLDEGRWHSTVIKGTSKRMDILAGKDKVSRVTPVLALDRDSDLLRRAVKRVATDPNPPPGLWRTIVVIPDVSEAEPGPRRPDPDNESEAGSKPGTTVHVVKLSELDEALGAKSTHAVI